IQTSFSLRENSFEAYRDKKVYDSLSFISFLNKLKVVAKPKAQAVIMFDEAAAVPSYLKDTFFLSLRKLLNERQSLKVEPATRFTFVFAGAFYPAALVTDTTTS